MLSNKSKNNSIYDDFFLEKTFNSNQMINFSKSEVDWLTSFLKLTKNETVLDVACGPGRHLKAFHDSGLNAYGVDLSPDCVRLAQVNCPEIKDQIIHADFLNESNLFNNQLFDLVFIAGVSFGYDPSLETNLLLLSKLLLSTKPNGHLAIQFLNKSWAIQSIKKNHTFWTEDSEFYILDKRTLTLPHLESTKIFIKKDTSIHKKYSDIVYLFNLDEIKTHLSLITEKLKIKFEILHVADSFSDRVFDEEKSATPLIILKRIG